MKRSVLHKAQVTNTAVFRGEHGGFDTNSALIHEQNQNSVTLPESGDKG